MGQGQAVTGRKILTGTPEFLGEVNRGPEPRAAGATEVASNGATGASAVSPENKLLNRAVPAQCDARYANGRTVVNERHGFMFSNHHHQENTTIERDDEGFTVRQPYLSALTDVLR